MFGSLKRTSSRLGGWQRRSAHADCRALAQIARHPLASRLSAAAVAALLTAAIAYSTGPPVPYRVGETPARDLRVRAYFEVLNLPQTDWAREEAGVAGPAPVVEKYPPGLPLVKRGQPITDRQHQLLREEQRAYLESLQPGDQVARAAALVLIALLLTFVLVLYVARFQAALAGSLSRVVGICVLVLGTLGVGLLLSRAPWHALLVPLTITALVLTIVYNPPFALLMSFSLALVATLALGTSVEYFLVLMSAVATAILLLGKVRSRTKLVHVAVGCGTACVVMTLATGLLTGQTSKFIAADAGRNSLWCLIAGFVLSGSLPLVERCFGVVTDVSLLEMANSSHPLLQELIRRAPGTYTHSMTVATLAEAAAEAVAADVLLTRVGCYFHDVGKMLKPHYFIENQSGENRHDALEPALSTLVIIGHVKDGVALAEQYALPEPVTDFIRQHHGTTLVEYFYREALRAQDGNGTAGAALEAAFRYPGPKPQTREAGIVMLADAVESSSRALGTPTPGSLQKLVRDLLMKRLLDGQFEESGLTLTELHLIEEALCKSLIALFHARIKYPDDVERLPLAAAV